MYSMDPRAIMNTQEIWAQPSPPPSSTSVTGVMTAVTSVDSRATAGSITQLSPSPPLLSSSPSLPSTDGLLVWLTKVLIQPNVTVTTTESSRNEQKSKGKCLLGVSDESMPPD